VQVGAGEPTGVKAVKLIGTAACMWAHASLNRGAQFGRRAVVSCQAETAIEQPFGLARWSAKIQPNPKNDAYRCPW
jgi:hypothetical protein